QRGVCMIDGSEQGGCDLLLRATLAFDQPCQAAAVECGQTDELVTLHGSRTRFDFRHGGPAASEPVRDLLLREADLLPSFPQPSGKLLWIHHVAPLAPHRHEVTTLSEFQTLECLQRVDHC